MLKTISIIVLSVTFFGVLFFILVKNSLKKKLEDLVKKEKRQWFKITKDHFKKNQYNIGLNKCLNRVPNLLI